MARGQVTLFIILVMVLLFAVGFLLFVVLTSVNSDARAIETRLVDELTTKTDVMRQIDSCVERAVETAVVDLLAKGGYANPGDVVTYQGKNYTALIRAPVLTPLDPSKTDNDYASQTNPTLFDSPIYPCRSVKQAGNGIGASIPGTNSNPSSIVYTASQSDVDCVSLYTFSTTSESFASPKQLPNLCKENYPTGCLGTPASPCYCKCSVGCDESVQAALESSITTLATSCIGEITVPGYDISFLDPEVDSFLTENTLDVTVIPHVQVGNSEINVALPASTHRIQAKLIAFHTLLGQHLFSNTLNEINHAHFDIGLAMKDAFSTLSVERSTFSEAGKYYNLLTFILEEGDGNINGQPLLFSFARENRPPVLEGVSSTVSLASGELFEICAADPDEDGLVFSLQPSLPFTTQESIDGYTRQICLIVTDSSYEGTLRITVSDVPAQKSDWRTLTIERS